MTTFPRLLFAALAAGIGCGSGGAKSLDAAGTGGEGATGGMPGGDDGAQVTGGAPGSGGIAPLGGTTATAGTQGTGGTFLDGGAMGPAVDAGPLGANVGSLELYGTFHAMGVIATLPAGSDSNQNAVANLDYRMTGAADYSAGFPLTRTGPTTFIGSLFWLAPGTSYDVRVRYSNPDGGALDKGWAAATASTRAEITIPSPTRTLVVAPTGAQDPVAPRARPVPWRKPSARRRPATRCTSPRVCTPRVGSPSHARARPPRPS